MPADNHAPGSRLTRGQQKQLLLLACAADRLEWRIQAKRLAGGSQRTAWLTPLMRLGLQWLPRVAGIRSPRGGPRWRRALFWVRTGLGLFV